MGNDISHTGPQVGHPFDQTHGRKTEEPAKGRSVSHAGPQVGHLFDHKTHGRKTEGPAKGRSVSHTGPQVDHLFDYTVHPHTRDERIDVAFNKATRGADMMTYNHIQDLFPDDLVRCMWPYLSGGKPTYETLTIDEFAFNVLPLLEFPLGVYVGIFRPVETFITVCASAAGVQMHAEDEGFLRTLSENMTEFGDTPEALFRWKTDMCSHMGRALNELICHQFLGTKMPKYHLVSRILCQSQMWFLQSCLPHNYFPKQMQHRKNQWTLLHATGLHGTSVQSFIHNVFGYRGHTVMIVKLNDGRTVALATEAEWRDDDVVHGGRNTAFFELEPEIKRLPTVDSFHCNFKSHSKGRGLVVKDVLYIDGDLSEVEEMEVWGCSGRVHHHEQEVQKQWMRKQKTRKMSHPSLCEGNLDKQLLLEMDRLNYSNEVENISMQMDRMMDRMNIINERENTEMEAKRERKWGENNVMVSDKRC